MSLTAVANDPATIPLLEDIAVRLAHERVPVRAIARTIRLSSEQIYELLRSAIERAVIVEMPRDDWPTSVPAASRVQSEPLQDEGALHIACIRAFKVTPQEAAVLAILLRRDHVTKEQVHSVIESTRRLSASDATILKQVDVVICKIRKKVKAHHIVIETLWNTGFCIGQETRSRITRLLLNHQEAA
jgi:hypothetical protein